MAAKLLRLDSEVSLQVFRVIRATYARLIVITAGGPGASLGIFATVNFTAGISRNVAAVTSRFVRAVDAPREIHRRT
jgi:hypothetical protein